MEISGMSFYRHSAFFIFILVNARGEVFELVSFIVVLSMSTAGLSLLGKSASGQNFNDDP
jgi:hypothetical protein